MFPCIYLDYYNVFYYQTQIYKIGGKTLTCTLRAGILVNLKTYIN